MKCDENNRERGRDSACILILYININININSRYTYNTIRFRCFRLVGPCMDFVAIWISVGLSSGLSHHDVTH